MGTSNSGKRLFGIMVVGVLLVASAALRAEGAGGNVAYGLAAEHPGDVGLSESPDVLILEDYELESMDELKEKGWSWSGGDSVYSLSTDPKLAFAGKRCLVKTLHEGALGAIMPTDLEVPQDGPVYHRVYTKIPADAPGVRVMGITGVRTGWPTWKAIGSAGVPADGSNYYCVTLTVRSRNGKLVFG